MTCRPRGPAGGGQAHVGGAGRLPPMNAQVSPSPSRHTRTHAEAPGAPAPAMQVGESVPARPHIADRPGPGGRVGGPDEGDAQRLRPLVQVAEGRGRHQRDVAVPAAERPAALRPGPALEDLGRRGGLGHQDAPAESSVGEGADHVGPAQSAGEPDRLRRGGRGHEAQRGQGEGQAHGRHWPGRLMASCCQAWTHARRRRCTSAAEAPRAMTRPRASTPGTRAGGWTAPRASGAGPSRSSRVMPRMLYTRV